MTINFLNCFETIGNTVGFITVRNLIIHHNDADGYCAAALAVWAETDKTASSVCVPITYGQEQNFINTLPDLLEYAWDLSHLRKIFVVDFSFTPEQLETIVEIISHEISSNIRPHIVWLDHHKTAEEYLIKWKTKYPSDEVVFGDENKSGADLALDYLNSINDDLCCDTMKDVTHMVSDYDLWKHTDKRSLPFITGVSAYKMSVDKWLNLLTDKSDIEFCITGGEAIIEQQTQYAENKVKNGFKIASIEGHRIAVINVPMEWVNIVSDELIYSFCVDAVICYSINDFEGPVKISMRAGKLRDINCGEFLRKVFGKGGGHVLAAGSGVDNYGQFAERLSAAVDEITWSKN